MPTANILSGKILAAPKFKEGIGLRIYDYMVANSPLSSKTWSAGITAEDDRYQRIGRGVPPAEQDYAYE